MTEDRDKTSFFKFYPDNSPTLGTLIWFKTMNGIMRWGDIPTIHRHSLFDHARNVMNLADQLGFILVSQGDGRFVPDRFKIGRLAYHHDDAEPITKDLPTPYKIDLSPSQRVELKQQEDAATSAIGHFTLMLTPQEHALYLSDRKEMGEKTTLESQIVEVADKLDAYGEILHEVRCGNNRYLEFVALRNQIITGLDRFGFWRKIKSDPSLDLEKLPDDKFIDRLPKISLNDFRERGDLRRLLIEGTMSEWTKFYCSWIDIQWKNAKDKDLEKIILPGWCSELWNKWGIPKGTKSTLSGISLPL